MFEGLFDSSQPNQKTSSGNNGGLFSDLFAESTPENTPSTSLSTTAPTASTNINAGPRISLLNQPKEVGLINQPSQENRQLLEATRPRISQATGTGLQEPKPGTSMSFNNWLYNLQHASDSTSNNPFENVVNKLKSVTGNMIGSAGQQIEGILQETRKGTTQIENPYFSEKLAGVGTLANVGFRTTFLPANIALEGLNLLPEGEKIKKNIVQQGFEAANNLVLHGPESLNLPSPAQAIAKIQNPHLRGALTELVPNLVLLGAAHALLPAESAIDLKPKDLVDAAAQHLNVSLDHLTPEAIQEAHRVASIKADSPEQTTLLQKAKDILNDHANLDEKDFTKKYKPQVETVQNITTDHVEELKKEALKNGFDKVSFQETPLRDRINNQEAPTGVITGNRELRVHPETLLADIKHLQNGGSIETQINGEPVILRKTTGVSDSQIARKYIDTLVRFEKEHLKQSTVGEAIKISEGEGAEVAKQMDERVMGKKASKIGTSIESKAIEQGLLNSITDKATYTPKVIKEQSRLIADILNKDIEQARRMIVGDEPIPSSISPTLLLKAVEDHALRTNDVGLIKDLARSPITSESSIHAQEMRMMAERNPDSAVARLQEIKKIKEESIKKSGLTKEKVVFELKERIKKEKAKQTRESWSSFIDSIQC